MIPLTYDACFKNIFINNLELLKELIIICLHLKLIPEQTDIKVLSNELLKDNFKEYHKTVDLYVQLNTNIFVSLEMNTEHFNNIKYRNFLFLNKLYTGILKSGQEAKILSDKYLYQLNLNAKDKNNGDEESDVVSYDLVKKKVYIDNVHTISKYLELYKEKYYNKDRSRETILLSSLLAKTFTEVYDILKGEITDEQLDKIIGGLIEMSQDEIFVHEWQKEDMEELVKNETYLNGVECGIEQGTIQGAFQKTIEVAKSMLNKKMSIKDIADITGLSKQEIENLKY